MKTFVITAHISLPVRGTDALSSDTLRMEVPADNEKEARRKARRFLATRVNVLIDDCMLKPTEQPAAEKSGKSFQEIMAAWHDAFNRWKP